MRLCPSRSCPTCIGTPACKSRVAQVCRKPWTVIGRTPAVPINRRNSRWPICCTSRVVCGLPGLARDQCRHVARDEPLHWCCLQRPMQNRMMQRQRALR
jgi:hypothetical protein